MGPMTDYYPDSQKSWQLLINGVNRIGLYLQDTLRGQDSEGSTVDSLSFDLVDQSGILALTPMQTVKLMANGSGIFGGFIQTVDVLTTGWVYPAYKVTAVSWHELLRKTETVVKSYANQTAKSILQDIFTQAGISGFNVTTYVQTGPTLETFSVPLTYLADALDLLCLVAGGATAEEPYVWRVTADAEIVFQSATDDTAPFAVADFSNTTYLTGGTVYPMEKEGLKLQVTQGDFFNRVVIDLGKQAGAEMTDTFSGNGSTYIFPLTKAPVQDVINVWVGGVAKRHGTKGYDSIGLGGVECLIDYAGGALWFAPGGAPTSGTDNVVITYRQLESIAFTYTSAGGYALAGNRWITRRVRHLGITNEEQAANVAAALLEMYASAFPKVVTFRVRRLGLQAGQVIAVTAPAALALSGSYVIRSVDFGFDRAQRSIIATVTAGTRMLRFSDFLGRTAPTAQAAFEQPTTPAGNNGIGIQRITDRVELLKPGTYFEWPG